MEQAQEKKSILAEIYSSIQAINNKLNDMEKQINDLKEDKKTISGDIPEPVKLSTKSAFKKVTIKKNNS